MFTSFDFTGKINVASAKDLLYANGAVVLHALLIIVAAVVINFVLTRIIVRLQTRVSHTENSWDDALLDAIGKPIRLLIWIQCITLVLERINLISKHEGFGKVVDLAQDVGIILMAAWFLLRLARRVESNILEMRIKAGKDVDHATLEAIGKLVRVSISFVAALVLLETLGFSISGVLAFGGIGGIAVGFAARDMLANFFGAMMIYMDRPFAVGDTIRSPDRNIEGTVEAISWRLTRIRTADRRPLYVPNSVFTSIAVENPSRMTNRRIYEIIGLRYEDAPKMAIIIEKIKKMLHEHPEIDQKQPIIVNFTEFAASSLDFLVQCYTRATDIARFHEVKQDVLFKVMEIVAGHEAQFAYPTKTVHFSDALQVTRSEPTKQTQV